MGTPIWLYNTRQLGSFSIQLSDKMLSDRFEEMSVIEAPPPRPPPPSVSSLGKEKKPDIQGHYSGYSIDLDLSKYALNDLNRDQGGKKYLS